MKKKPLIGITGLALADTISPMTPFHAVRQSYLTLIEKMGGVPLILTSTDDKKILTTYASLIDGLLLPGGGDIHPNLYKRKMHPKTGKYHMTINNLRDRTEIYLLKKCLSQKKPVIGICRGCQLINIALGGTLIQDIKTHFRNLKETHLDISNKNHIFDKRHAIRIEKKSKLFGFVNKAKQVVNSAHHQAIGEVAIKLRVSARSNGGVIEAIEHSDRFLFGVQWHPEMLLNDKLT